MPLDAQIAALSALTAAAHRKAHVAARLAADPDQAEFVEELRVELQWTLLAMRAFLPEINPDEAVVATCWSSSGPQRVQMCSEPLTPDQVATAAASALPSLDAAWREVLDAAGCTSTNIALSSTPVYEQRSVISRALLAVPASIDREAHQRLLQAAALIEGNLVPADGGEG